MPSVLLFTVFWCKINDKGIPSEQYSFSTVYGPINTVLCYLFCVSLRWKSYYIFGFEIVIITYNGAVHMEVIWHFMNDDSLFLDVQLEGFTASLMNTSLLRSDNVLIDNLLPMLQRGLLPTTSE